jgi:hypothetical protein
VDVPVGAKLLVSTNAQADFTAGSSLTVAGQLEVQDGTRLRLDGNTPARDVTLVAGSSMIGHGTIRFEGNNRLLLLANATVGTGLLDFSGTSTIAATNLLLTIASGSTARFDHSATIVGSVTVDGTLTLTGVPITLAITQTLTLDPTGVLNNSDTIRVGVFVNNNGKVNGNAPVVVGPVQQALTLDSTAPLIDHVQVFLLQPRGRTSSTPVMRSAGSVILTWQASPGSSFSVESSTELKRWTPVQATVLENSPGEYHATIVLSGSDSAFYRLRSVANPSHLISPRPFER